MEKRASYYEILRISPNASDDDVKRAYHILAKKHHPDRNPHSKRLAELRFRLISEAYAGLKTREKRLKYNQTLHMKAQNDNTGVLSQLGAIFWPKKSGKLEQ